MTTSTKQSKRKARELLDKLGNLSASLRRAANDTGGTIIFGSAMPPEHVEENLRRLEDELHDFNVLFRRNKGAWKYLRELAEEEE